MLRCAICNYTSEDGSDLLDKAPKAKNKVRFNPKHQEFLCTDCSNEINRTTSEFEFNDCHKS